MQKIIVLSFYRWWSVTTYDELFAIRGLWKIEYRGIIEKIFTLFKQEGRLDETAIQSVLSPSEYDIYSRLVVMSDDEYKVQVPGLIRKIRLHSLREQYKAHSIMADQLKRAGDSTFISNYISVREIQNLIREWSKVNING